MDGTGEAKVTLLVDNQAPEGLASEHGLSLLIETDGRRMLLDTGQGGAFDANVASLGVDLRGVDVLVLSHGHYDHTGGIPRVLADAPEAEVYFHPGLTTVRYAVRDGAAKRIDLPEPSRRALEEHPAARKHLVEGRIAVTERVGLAAPIPRSTSFEDTGGPFYLDPEGRRPDPIEDDLALWIDTEQGLVICVGCAHAGVVNTARHLRALAGHKRVRAIVGGFHLNGATPERMDETIVALRMLSPDLVVPCHCTGEAAVGVFAQALGDMVMPGRAGLTLRF